jgi:multicomponent Na+:H+ antiporter subunit E
MTRVGRISFQLVLLFGFWMALTDQHEPLFIGLGLITAVTVTVLTQGIVATVLTESKAPDRQLGRLRHLWWGLVFVVWLLGRIVAASVQLAWFAINDRRPFEPRFVRFHTEMQRPLSRVVLALTITVVPGTLTVHLEGDEYLVHSLLPTSADDLASARMQNLIGRWLGEAPEPPPELRWHEAGRQAP